MTPWLHVVGIGEDGMEGLGGAARTLVAEAELLVGGLRHLALVPAGRAERLVWAQPLAATIEAIAARRGRGIVVLASGDPLCYGVGAMLARHFPPDEMLVLPQPSAFSLAAARLVWPLADCTCLSLHGRPLDTLRLHLSPGARLLALTSDGGAPAEIAALLSEAGWGPSRIIVLEHLGGPAEKIVRGAADAWPPDRSADLNLVAIDCRPAPGTRAVSRLAGLPDNAFLHDGQLTKRAVRAATLAALGPLPGELLWDVGAGCGSIAIEWLRAAHGMRAVAIERVPARAGFVARNAARLGVPGVEIVTGEAPAALAGLPAPDAIFLGGGNDDPALWQTVWQALQPGGRLVANAVTVEGEGALARWHKTLGGSLTRLSVAHAEPLGERLGWRTAMTVTQLAATKDAAP
jgi:precorrin-6Y C5,15-methyltransferase (decarboxylating)